MAIAPLHAQQQDDQRRLLEQRGQRQAAERERALLKDELDTGRPVIHVDGKAYTVGHNANDVGRALYLSLQHRQWDAAQAFLDEYLTLPDRDPLLVHYGQGALARIGGRYRQAEREYRALLALKPDFLPGRLELARVLFEDQQDREADRLFAAIDASIDAADPKTEGVRRSIANFHQALAERRGWNGSFALGPAWSDNVNRTSASHVCLVYFGDQCFFDRSTPQAIVAAGYDYDANVDRRLPLRGHHGLYLRSLLFGQGYRDNSLHNELTSVTQAGYSYRSGRHSVALAPSFDYYAWGNDALYGAWGAHAEWSWTLSPSSLLKLEGDWKDMRYRRALYAANYDGVVRSAYATWFRSLGERWTVFGGVDVVDNAAAEPVNAHLQKGVRLGASLQWPAGFTGTLFASYRRRDYGAYSELLGARRRDDEQGYILVVKASRLAFAGFTPLLTLRHNRVASNVDWLYGYDKNSASLKLERLF
ncbi:MAG TPA: hypothetical protein DDZ67_08255 [Xanthomonadaceae bacterium]|nr:hypothetical protein [Xanthomonadaceae bacterium]